MAIYQLGDKKPVIPASCFVAENATIIGLIPDLPRERFRYIGNSSLTGSYMVVVSQDFRQRQLELARRMTYLELSADNTFYEAFTSALFLPHTDFARFPTVQAALLKPEMGV